MRRRDLMTLVAVCIAVGGVVVGSVVWVRAGSPGPMLTITETAALTNDIATIVLITDRTPTTTAQWRRRCGGMTHTPRPSQRAALGRIVAFAGSRRNHVLQHDDGAPSSTVRRRVVKLRVDLGECRRHLGSSTVEWAAIDEELRRATD